MAMNRKRAKGVNRVSAGEVLLRRCREKAGFRTGTSRQDFGGAKLYLGIDKVKYGTSAEWLFFSCLPAKERPMMS